MTGYSLGEPEFVSTSALREYCSNARRLIRPLGPELHMASIELRAALKELPAGGGMLNSVDSRVRARIVAAHLKHASQGIDEAVAGLVRTYMSFQKHFLNAPAVGSRRKYFDLNG